MAALSARRSLVSLVRGAPFPSTLVTPHFPPLPLRAVASPDMRHSRIAVLEPHPPAPLSSLSAASPPDLRTFAITPASARALTAAGVWGHVAAFRAPAFRSMQVWDALGPGHLRFGGGHGGGELGWIVEQGVLAGALGEAMGRLAGTGRLTLKALAVKEFHLPGAGTEAALPPSARLSPPTAGTPLTRLTLADGSSLTARLVVGADGAASQVRAAARIGSWGTDYDARAVVATVTAAPGSLRSTAWQRFLPHGPVAVLPLWGDYASIVWSTTPSHADALVSSSPDAFLASLNAVLTAPHEAFMAAVEGGEATPPGEGFDRRRDVLWLDPLHVAAQAFGAAQAALGRLSDGGPSTFAPPPSLTALHGGRASFPLRNSGAASYVRNRVALIGDAAHTVHPLAGQGLNMGLADADALCGILARAAAVGSDLGSLGVLRGYERERVGRNLLLQGGLQAVQAAFSGSGSSPLARPWAAARSLGLTLLNSAAPAKELLQRVAMGNY